MDQNELFIHVADEFYELTFLFYSITTKKLLVTKLVSNLKNPLSKSKYV